MEDFKAKPIDVPDAIPDVPLLLEPGDISQTLSEVRQLLKNSITESLHSLGLPELSLWSSSPEMPGGKNGADKAENAKPFRVGDAVPGQRLGPDDLLSVSELQKLSKQVFADDKQQQRFGADLEHFNQRAECEQMPLDEREKFYAQVGRMLQDMKDGGNKRFSAEEMGVLALDTMLHAAYPGSVNQGSYATCAVASLESALYKAEPSTIARLVADVAISGQYNTADGTAIIPLERNLKADKYNVDAEYKKRSSANQIAQVTLVNVHWNRQERYDSSKVNEASKKGKIFYEEGHPKDHIGDSHVRLMDRSVNPAIPFTYTDTEGDPIADEQTPGIDHSHSIYRPLDSPMMSMPKVSDIYGQLVGNQRKVELVSIDRDKHYQSPKTFDEFKALFDKAVESGTLKRPIVLEVHANVEPFKSDLMKLSKALPDAAAQARQDAELAKMHAQHAVAVFDYDATSGMVTVENQWGLRADHTGRPGSGEKIHISQLYKTYINESDSRTSAESPSPPAKKSVPDDFINQQRKFVTELSLDNDVAPEKLLSERATLYRYVDHWKGQAAARPIAVGLVEDLKSVVRSSNANYGQQLKAVAEHLPLIQKAGMQNEAVQVLAVLDKRFEQTIKEGSPFSVTRLTLDLVNLHASVGDNGGANALLPVLSAALEKGRTGDIEVCRKWNSSSEMAISILKNAGFAEAGKQIYDQMCAEALKLEKERGPQSADVVEAKLRLLSISSSSSDKQIDKSVFSQLEDTYNAVKSNANFPEETFLHLTCALRDHYVVTRSVEKLDKIITEIVDGIARKYDDVRPGSGYEHENMLGPLRLHATLYADAGLKEKALSMMEKSYAIAMKGPDNGDRREVAISLAAMYREAARVEDAERVERENHLKARRTKFNP